MCCACAPVNPALGIVRLFSDASPPPDTVGYASRYRCKRHELVYPASMDCAPGKFKEFILMTQVRQMLEADVRELAFGSGAPAGLEGMILIERHWKQRSSQTPVYEAI